MFDRRAPAQCRGRLAFGVLTMPDAANLTLTVRVRRLPQASLWGLLGRVALLLRRRRLAEHCMERFLNAHLLSFGKTRWRRIDADLRARVAKRKSEEALQ